MIVLMRARVSSRFLVLSQHPRAGPSSESRPGRSRGSPADGNTDSELSSMLGSVLWMCFAQSTTAPASSLDPLPLFKVSMETRGMLPPGIAELTALTSASA